METTTLIVLMATALVVMAVVVGALVMRLVHKNDELKEKNDIIVREIRRNQTIIDRAVQHGVSRAALLSVSLLLLGSISVLTSCSKGSTLFMPYYGAMYEAGAVAPYFQPKALLIGANPEDEAVSEAMQGFGGRLCHRMGH